MDSITQRVIRTAAPRFTARLSQKRARYLFDSGEGIRGAGAIVIGFALICLRAVSEAVVPRATLVIEKN